MRGAKKGAIVVLEHHAPAAMRNGDIRYPSADLCLPVGLKFHNATEKKAWRCIFQLVADKLKLLVLHTFQNTPGVAASRFLR